MLLVFDLDDTLYNERAYVESGLRAVAEFGQEAFGWNRQASLRCMIDALNREGRGAIFNRWLASHGREQKSLVQKCVHIYRHHTPRLRLDTYAQKLLPSLKNYPLYVVTDGHKVVQQRKIEALGIERCFRKIFITHRYGLHHAKPSTYCFDLIRKRERCDWRDMVYIADNPAKDFVNLNKLGVTTVRVRTGMHKNAQGPKACDARYTIPNLSHLRKLLSLGTKTLGTKQGA